MSWLAGPLAVCTALSLSVTVGLLFYGLQPGSHLDRDMALAIAATAALAAVCGLLFLAVTR